MINAGNCGRVTGHVIVVYYTSRAGYRGPDAGSIDFTYFAFSEGQTMKSDRQNFTITVK